MDGYAVRVADVEGASEEFPAVLTVIGDVAAGDGGLADGRSVGPGEAARIMTGAPLPRGRRGGRPGRVDRRRHGRRPGRRHARPQRRPGGGERRGPRPPSRRGRAPTSGPRGSDVQPGDLALRAGSVVGPPQIGLLAAIGRSTVRVRPRPRVVVLSTGSELVQPGEELTGGRIYDSNSFALTAAARDAGAIAYRVPRGRRRRRDAAGHDRGPAHPRRHRRHHAAV